MRHHCLMPISCHFQYCKALLVTSLTHVSGTIASVQAFTFYLQFSQLISVIILLSDNLSHSISLAKKLINFSCSLRQNY